MVKRLLCILLCFLFFTACMPEDTTPETTIPETTVSETQAPTKPVHSALYIPGVEVEDVIRYFNEVALDAEFSDGGDPSKLQKWDRPIYYLLNGNPTEQDRQVIADFAAWLNSIPGFPGMYETQDWGEGNLKIYFCVQQEMANILGDNFYGMDGGVTFWYENDAIYDATICYRTDISQYVRNSVLLEEIYNGLGPVQDTTLRKDSIIYSGYSTPQKLTAVDELILKLLYHSEMLCGMSDKECEAIIRQLYY